MASGKNNAEFQQNQQRKWVSDLEYSRQELMTLNELSEQVASGDSPQSIQAAALERIVGLMKADIGYIYLFDETMETLYLSTEFQTSPPPASRMVEHVNLNKINHLPLHQVIRLRQGFLLEDVRSDQKLVKYLLPYVGNIEYTTWICAPLHTGEMDIGAISAAARSDRRFGQEDLRLLKSVGNMLGAALCNARLLDQLRSNAMNHRKEEGIELHESIQLAHPAFPDPGILSNREREVLVLISKGYTSREIGERLFLSVKTVETYRNRMMVKLNLTHRSELVEYALNYKML